MTTPHVLALGLLLIGCASPTPFTETDLPVFSVTAAPADYTVLYIPDTQYYSEAHPATWDAQVQWIVAHRDSLNIVFVSHLGDVVDHADSPVEWQRADAAMAVLDPVVPLGIAPGNHDIEPVWGGTHGSWSTYHQYFPPSRYATKPYWGGSYGANGRASSYQLLTVGGEHLLFLHLEFQAPDDVLAWARSVVDAYPDYRVSVSTHSYLAQSGARMAFSKHQRLNGNQGEDIWQELVRRSPNIRSVHSAHICGETRNVSTNDVGVTVDEFLVDYQCRPNGGDGWLRFYVFKPSVGEIHAHTYSPTRDEWDTDAESQFVLPYTPAAPPSSPSATVEAIPSVVCGPQAGSKATCTFDASGSVGAASYLWHKGGPSTVAEPVFTQTVTSPRRRVWSLVAIGPSGLRDSVGFAWAVPDTGLVEVIR